MKLHSLAPSMLMCLILCSVVAPARADEAALPADSGVPPSETPKEGDPLLGWSITPGVGIRVLRLQVERVGDGYWGTLTNNGGSGELSLDVESPSWMVTRSFGFSMRSHSQTFRATLQEVNNAAGGNKDLVDLGTSASGHYSYVGPTFFYRSVEANGGDARFGLGYGYWKAWWRGDIVLAKDGVATTGMPRSDIGGTIDGKNGLTFFMQGRGPKWLFELSISTVSLSQSEYRSTLQEVTMNIGYQLIF